MAQKIEISQYKNYLEFREKAKTDLPNLMIYCSLDSYEFDILADHYREILKSKEEAFEVAIFVSEPGDLEKLFSEVFNLSMFSSLKLIIIKSGSDFFKPLLLAKGKALYDNFKRSIPELSEKVYLLIHYDDKDIPSKLLSMFQHKLGLLKNRNFYPNEKKAALESILKFEKITLDPAASDEFIHRIPPNTGSYLKNIQKLKLLLNKKEYTLEDIEEALFGNVDFNPFHITDLFFSGDKRE
ncbi:MAG: DNA polymerase III subunit delta, partial [Leptospiraceae bacterium]|nr:DNA polymerase III subunit delta [Leptospiraceae bacterium]